MWQWSSVQAIEAMALVTAWPSLRTASKIQSASEAAPPPPRINATFESSWSAFIEGVTERLGWVLTRPVRDRRTRVEKKWQSPKSVWSGVCADSWWIFKQHGGTCNHCGRREKGIIY